MKLSFGLVNIVLSVHAGEINRVAAPGTHLFEKYRPKSHFLIRRGWMNDPCGPFYDEVTKLYHLYYQYNPFGTDWGNMNWGHAVSPDQVVWEDYPNAMKPDSTYDRLGVFSGQVISKGIDDMVTAFYTGATALPINFAKPYKHGEHVLYATSADRGITWTKGDEPLIISSPEDMDVTGWRDPFVFESKSLDLAYNEINTYMIVSGGIRDKGPCLFLYTSPSKTYKDWKYKGILFHEEKRTSFSPFSENWGLNFEMSTFMEIEDEYGAMFNVLFIAEESEIGHHTLWMLAKVGSPSDSSLLKPQAVGNADKSGWYASNVFKDPHTNKYVVNAWITEDNGRQKQAQGWNGMLALPREVNVITIHDILDPSNFFSTRGNWMKQSRSTISCDGKTFVTSTIKTLSIKPIPQLTQLRVPAVGVTIPSITFEKAGDMVLSSRSKTFELYAEISDFMPGSRVGIKVRQNTVEAEYTSIIYDDTQASISIDRKASCNMKCPESLGENKPANTTITDYFKIYEMVQTSGDKCVSQREALRIRIFVDVSVVEVFVNDRIALSARIYPCESFSDAADQISVFSSNKATFNVITVWPTMKDAWPYRHNAQSSSYY